jgi:hypothetical protein
MEFKSKKRVNFTYRKPKQYARWGKLKVQIPPTPGRLALGDEFLNSFNLTTF